MILRRSRGKPLWNQPPPDYSASQPPGGIDETKDPTDSIQDDDRSSASSDEEARMTGSCFIGTTIRSFTHERARLRQTPIVINIRCRRST